MVQHRQQTHSVLVKTPDRIGRSVRTERSARLGLLLGGNCGSSPWFIGQGSTKVAPLFEADATVISSNGRTPPLFSTQPTFPLIPRNRARNIGMRSQGKKVATTLWRQTHVSQGVIALAEELDLVKPLPKYRESNTAHVGCVSFPSPVPRSILHYRNG